MPDPADSMKAVQEQLEKLDLDNDQTPDYIEDAERGAANDEGKKKIARAFHDLRSTLKTARGVIEELSKKPETAAPAPAPQIPQDRKLQMQAYLAKLTAMAMDRTGIPDPNDPIVNLERQRLYANDMSMAERAVTAERDSEKVVGTVLSEFKQLGEVEVGELKKKLGEISPVERLNPDVVRAKVHQYIGENWERFASRKATPTNGKTDPASSAAAAAASSVKSMGGVVAGEGAVGGSASAGSIKPASEAELRDMRKLGIPADRPDLYRKAVAKKAKYMPT